MTEEEKRMFYKRRKMYRRDVERKAFRISSKVCIGEHLKDEHLNKCDAFLQQVMLAENKKADSSFITDDEDLVFAAIDEALRKRENIEALLDFLAWPEEDWESSEEFPNGTGFQMAFELPEGVTGHLFDDSIYLWYLKPAIECSTGIIVISRNRAYVKDMQKKRKSNKKPFILKTAYPVEY